MSKTDVVLCIDCKHVKVKWFGRTMVNNDHVICKKSADNISVNLVTGKLTSDLATCEYFRSGRRSDTCGPEGKFWVPRDPKKIFVLMSRDIHN